VSTIKSSAEDLTLNADGSGNDIKFQINAVEKASINSSGLLTSTTIDATALTGNLPAIDGSSLTGLDDNTPSFKAKLSGTQTLTSGVVTLIEFATEEFDTDSAFTNTASNYKFTVPVGAAGKYCFFFMNRIQSMTDGSKADFMIRINGSTDVEKASHAAHTQHLSGTVVCISDLSEGDYVQCYIYQNSGSDKTLYASTNFGGWKLI